ncbi:MAG: DUF1697 domain-containing protein [Alicyclobacillus macrosporangiidus]|uniref:DUF1697 domain-containing protein n=1 Tax=Alicyclobacillus macrosporangiidus TaxID=392015 RepID=UPI0026EB72BB|nr:DUF1697 domain-containing protein [Alicyclobacillus macrosporangiidus]MCL6597160.1 DUF1697 domain-containing protein [Alicyclobacillus macrosporangiidus]
MTVYIALLRGVNVGGHNKIKMAELKRTFEWMGLGRVQTYIQSGNVLFESEEEDEDTLRRRLEREIGKVFGISTTVVLRTAREFERIVENCPFTKEELSEAEASSEGECLYVSLLLKAPSQEGIEKLSAFRSERDEYRIKGREVYLLFRHGVRNSKLAVNLDKLDVPSTMRNWNTINKLAVLAREMEA